jgi:hypothetical protein
VSSFWWIWEEFCSCRAGCRPISASLWIMYWKASAITVFPQRSNVGKCLPPTLRLAASLWLHAECYVFALYILWFLAVHVYGRHVTRVLCFLKQRCSPVVAGMSNGKGWNKTVIKLLKELIMKLKHG